MAITRGAKKAIRSSARKRIFNVRKKKPLHDEVKRFRMYVDEGKRDEAKQHIPVVYKAIDKAAKRGVIKPNTAARKKSRLMKALAKIS